MRGRENKGEPRFAITSDDSGRSGVWVLALAPYRPFGPPPPEGEAWGAVVLFTGSFAALRMTADFEVTTETPGFGLGEDG